MQASKVGRWSLLKLDSSRNAKLIKETIGVTQSHSEKACVAVYVLLSLQRYESNE